MIKSIISATLSVLLVLLFVPISYATAEDNYEELDDNGSVLIGVDSNNIGSFTTDTVKSLLKSKTDFSKSIESSDIIYDSSKYNTNSEGNTAIIKINLNSIGSRQIESIIKELQNNSSIRFAERDYVLSILEEPNNYSQNISTNTVTATISPYSSLVSVNDTYYGNQYGLTTSHANMAWAIQKGSASVKVGIIDTGIDPIHADLNGNLNTSLSETFISGTSTYVDINGHGTHVAGIIGAETNNSTGVAGVCWNVKLVSLKCFNAIGSGYSSDVISAINYAAGNGIKILNCSFGYTQSTLQNENNYSALRTAISNFPGIVLAASGNNGSSTLLYPAAYNLNNIISVASLNSNNSLSTFSNYGTTVDLAAPGNGIYSTYLVPSYQSLSGTSMATPFVTGTAALLYSINPNYTTTQIRNLILNNVDVDSALSGVVVTSGRLNVFKSVVAASGKLMGDVDNSNSVTSADARLVSRFVVNLESFTALQKVLADINMDGVVDSDDARNINRIAVGLEPN